MSQLETAAGTAARRRARVRVRGTVQGVGFRPYVFRLARELGLDGFVLNDDRGVVLEVEGVGTAVDEFVARVAAEAPPLASVESVDIARVPPCDERGFRILESRRAGDSEALVSPDTTTCAECLAEVFDPADRRYRYPFTNCTNCGPRFTIVRGIPYDRPQTTMAGFEMCPACRAEYEDPGDRRFHAQPNACPRCGPSVRLTDSDGRALTNGGERDAIAMAARLLRERSIVAIKGLGGYHLACRADDSTAVAELRRRKHRQDRPFALMAPSIAAARELVELTGAEEAMLEGPERPIVIARRRPGAEVTVAVAPHSPDLGVMLPYSPLHHLLLADSGAVLVMTSGNVSDEPIAYEDGDALERLGAIADWFLLHDRPIHTRTDDSVVRSLSPRLRPAPLLVRRSRGYVPRSVELPLAAGRPILACGAELKSTFCLVKGRRAWVGHHIGDLRNWETLRSFRDGVEHFEALFTVDPELVAHDLHPDYLATRYALEREGPERIAIQHHHAHLAACLAEHGVQGEAVGAIYDGTGLGPDGTVWGGELLAGGLCGYERAGSLFTVPLPGGDAAVRHPWRMACAWLVAALGEERPRRPATLRDRVSERDWVAVCELVRTGTASPPTTSAGRLFDAVAALCGLRVAVTYEGQAAVELEAASDPSRRDAYPLPMIDGGSPNTAGRLVLDARETVRAVLVDIERGADLGAVGGRFHEAVAVATADACEREARRRGLDVTVLSGGVFQNRLLLERTAALLDARGLHVLIPQRLPPNDGGIAYGQAAIAAASIAGVER